MPFAFGQTCFTFDEYLRRKVEESDIGTGPFETGDIVAFENGAEEGYVYVQGDATMAYNNPRYSYTYRNSKTGESRTNKPKIDLFTRSMVYFPNSDNLIVFDRVQSLDPTWRKAWLSHFQGKPEIVGGKLLHAEVPGHIEEFSGDVIEMTWADGVLKPPDPNDPGRLFIRTFLPEKHTIRRVGGDGYEEWANGKNRTGDMHKIIDKVDAGRWRVEISPVEPRSFDTFLHLIHIGDSKTKTIPSSEMITSKDGRMVGVMVEGSLVMFGQKGQVRGQVVYEVPQGKFDHLLVDLLPGAGYLLSGSDVVQQKMTVSPEGTLRFATTSPGTIKLIPVKVIG